MKAHKVIVFRNFLLRGPGTTLSLCQPWTGHESSVSLVLYRQALDCFHIYTHLVSLASIKEKPKLLQLTYRMCIFSLLKNFIDFIFWLQKFHSMFTFCEKNMPRSFLPYQKYFSVWHQSPEDYLKCINDIVLLFCSCIAQ